MMEGTSTKVTVSRLPSWRTMSVLDFAGRVLVELIAAISIPNRNAIAVAASDVGSPLGHLGCEFLTGRDAVELYSCVGLIATRAV